MFSIIRHALDRCYPPSEASGRERPPPDLPLTCPTMTDFHDLEMTSITGEQVAFDQYRGQLSLVVNVASR